MCAISSQGSQTQQPTEKAGGGGLWGEWTVPTFQGQPSSSSMQSKGDKGIETTYFFKVKFPDCSTNNLKISKTLCGPDESLQATSLRPLPYTVNLTPKLYAVIFCVGYGGVIYRGGIVQVFSIPQT